MPRLNTSPIHRITTMFLDLDGGEMETVIDIFRAIHARRTERLAPKLRPATGPVVKAKVKAKPKATPATVTEAAAAQ